MKTAQYKFLILLLLLLLLLIIIINACPVRDAIIFPALSCGRAKSIWIRYVSTRIFSKKEKKVSSFLKKKKFRIRANEPKIVYKMQEMCISKTLVLMEITLRLNGRSMYGAETRLWSIGWEREPIQCGLPQCHRNSKPYRFQRKARFCAQKPNWKERTSQGHPTTFVL